MGQTKTETGGKEKKAAPQNGKGGKAKNKHRHKQEKTNAKTKNSMHSYPGGTVVPATYGHTARAMTPELEDQH